MEKQEEDMELWILRLFILLPGSNRVAATGHYLKDLL